MSFHFRGTALGGWLVLEPWITPSLFYQFLGASERYGDNAPNKIGLDSFTFCTALGNEEANRQLRQHWKTWVTEEQISNLKKTGVDTLRIPVGDWMYVPYEPYIGCMDGANEELDRVLDLCRKYEINVLLDVHAMIGSQNGLDNSGNTGSMQWVATKSTGGAARYKHWEIRGGNWVGDYNTNTQQYDNINYANIAHAVEVIRALVERHKNDPIIVAVEPLNEPWWLTPIDILQKFYKDSNNLVQASAPKWVTVLHDSFRPSRAIWAEFMHDCVNCALDTHIYQAWAWPNEQGWFTGRACMDGDRIKTSMEMYDIPIIVGEWSLAIDNCAMWLNGFNDNVPGYPLVECERIKCPEPYMGEGQANAPPDPSKDAQDPFGTGGESYVINGTCPRDGFIANEDVFMRKLAYIKLNAFDYGTHGQFFWNFRTELEPRWDYQAAVARGWIPATYDNSTMSEIASACDNPYDIPESAMLKSAAPKLKESAHLHSTPFELFSRGGQPYPYNPTTHSLPRDIIPGLSQDTGSVSNTSLSVSSTSHMLVSLTALVILSLFAVWYWIRQKSMGSRKQQYASISSYVTDSGKYTGSDKYGFASERDSLLRGHYQTSVGRVDEINI